MEQINVSFDNNDDNNERWHQNSIAKPLVSTKYCYQIIILLNNNYFIILLGQWELSTWSQTNKQSYKTNMDCLIHLWVNFIPWLNTTNCPKSVFVATFPELRRLFAFCMMKYDTYSLPSIISSYPEIDHLSV